jgi:hypothetical protein
MNSKAIFPLDEWVGNEDNPIQVVETSHTTIAVNGTNGILAALISSTPEDQKNLIKLVHFMEYGEPYEQDDEPS